MNDDETDQVVSEAFKVLRQNQSFANADYRQLKNPAKWISTESYHACLWTSLGGIAPMKMPYDFDDENITRDDIWNGKKVHSTIGTRLGAILDLTEHDSPCYSTLEHRIRHVSMQFRAKTIPLEDEVIRFNVVLSQLLKVPEEEKKSVVAVHCHYGFNRTGYMLCCFLMDVCNMSWYDAAFAFSLARPPGIRHDYMVDALKERSSSGVADTAKLVYQRSMRKI